MQKHFSVQKYWTIKSLRLLINKIPLSMRLSILFLFCFMGLAQASESYAQKTKISIEMANKTVGDVLEEIESQTDFDFFFNNKHVNLDRIVSVSAENKDIYVILEQVFSGTDVNFSVLENKIILTTEKHDAIQQAASVKGQVVDTNGEPIIGASVVVKGTINGAITDIDGNFSIPNVKEGDIIKISFVGYVTQEVKWNGQTLNVVLKDDTQALEEVVVVGYGVEKKVNVVGSISTVSAKKLENRSTPSVTNALTGQMPGVTVRQTSGSPGADGGEIRIRGVGSFGATPSALVLVDGIPGSLTDLHMEDIESISVLKDASTAAIYGSRAANGVILVTTKTGKVGKPKVNYNGYVGFSSATELPQKVDTWEYATLYNIANGSEVYSAAEIQKFKDGSDPDHYANSRYLEELFHSGLQTGHDLSVSGGTEGNKYMLSVGYLYQDGIVDKNNYQRFNARLNMVTDLWKNVTLTSRIQGVYGDREQPNVPYGKDSSGLNAIISNSLRWPGTVPTVLSNGNYGAGEEGYGTSLMWLKTPSFSLYDFHNVSLNERLDWKVIDGLTLSLIGGYTYTGTESKNFRSTYTTDVRTSTGNHLTNQTTKEIYKTFQATLDWNRSFGKHNVGVLAGYSWEQNDYRYLSATRTNLPSDDYPEIDTGDADSSSNSGGGNAWSLQSYFGRAKYNFNERYLAEFTFRYDGSSRFPEDNRFAFFPSVAAGWRISEESFIKDNFDWINNLKIKASWGKLGNQNIGNYPYQSVYNIGYNYPFGNTLQQGVAITTAVDETLHWETTTTTDLGIEGTLWNGLLNFDVTYFYRKTKDILFSPSASVSSIFGFSLSQMNMGQLKNDGFELQLGHNNTIGDFTYGISGNFSIIRNEVITLGLADVEQSNGLIGNGTYFVGYPMNIYYGYKTDGVFMNEQEITDWPDQNAIAKNSKVGDIRYVDHNKDGVVNADDRTILGSRIPKFTYGLSLNMGWKGIDFSAQFQGVADVKGYLSEYAGYAFFGYGSIQRWQADDYFNPDSPKRYPAYPRLEIINNSSNNTLTSDFWVRDASYLRVKSVQLGYTFPQNWMKKIGINSARIYAQCENPITFHNYPEGWDPEINTGGSYYPILKTYTFGINLNF